MGRKPHPNGNFPPPPPPRTGRSMKPSRDNGGCAMVVAVAGTALIGALTLGVRALVR